MNQQFNAGINFGNNTTNHGNLPPGKLPPCNSPLGEIPSLENLDGRKKKRDKIVKAALNDNPSLSATVQETLLKAHLNEGWGKLAHGITRQLKSPTRYGLKLVDVALIMTVYDLTIAQVNSVAFAPISGDDFRRETGMDDSNIRIALNSLVNRGILLKNKTDQINFWGINPHYFTSKDQGDLPPGKRPPGKSPEGTAHEVKQGNLPGGNGGQTTRGQASLTPETQSEIPVAKNLKESKKESSLGGAFPEDLLTRWSRLEKSGASAKAKSEREIFQDLFLIHGKSFFENCDKVLDFLEKHGNGKDGDAGVIHSPMKYLSGYWEINLTRFQNHQAKEKALQEAHAKKIEKEAKAKVEANRQEDKKASESQEEAEWTAKLNADIEQFRNFYSGKEEASAFIDEAIEVQGNSFVRNSWNKFGWNSELVKSCVVSHFCKVMAGERQSRVQPTLTEKSA